MAAPVGLMSRSMRKAVRLQEITVNNCSFPLRIYVEKRSYSRVYIGRRGVNIRIPASFGPRKRATQIESLVTWARARLRKHPERFLPPEQKTYRHGQRIEAGGREYTLDIRYKDKKSSSGRVRGTVIALSLSSRLGGEEQARQISTLIPRCLAAEALPRLKERIDGLNRRHFNAEIGTVRFKNTRSNWGSCSRKGNVNISARLLLAPEEVLDYVCIHELAHLSEPHHGPRFWQRVEQALPEYRRLRRWLKENQQHCRF